VREHAAGAIANGLALHGGLIPYASTFLVFSDYMRPALRLAAMMQTHAIFIFSHDSIALGEDGPTHQPVEHLASLRAIPGLTVFRPADANETAACWRLALERRGPSVLALSRQRLPVLDPARHPVEAGASRGAYLLGAEGKPPRKAGRPGILLLATGSEVHLALEAAGALKERGLAARVASMPSLEVFAEQPEDYRQSVLIPGVPRLAIEAASPLGWHEYVGDTGTVIGLERFGASAPGPEVYRHLGFNVERVVAEALRLANAKPPPARRGRKEPS